MNPEIFGELQGSEMVISRLVAAPQELVFRALTSPNHLANWWGPEGFSITTLAWDFREGGHWRSIMHGPDGTDYPNRLIYQKINPPHRLEYLHDDDGHSSQQFQGSLELKPEGDATRITLRARFASEAEAREMMERANAIEGGKQTLEVFANRECKVDLRPGGEFLVVMVSPQGVDYPAMGRVLEVQKPHRLVLELRVEEPPGNLVLQTRVEVQFASQGKGASLRLKLTTTHCQGRGFVYVQGMEAGWSQSLEKLKRIYPK